MQKICLMRVHHDMQKSCLLIMQMFCMLMAWDASETPISMKPG